MAGRRYLLAIVLLAAILHTITLARTLLPAQDGLKFFRIARQFQTQDRRRAGRGRIAAAPLQQIGTVERRCVDAHQQFVRTRHGIGRVANVQYIGITGTIKQYRFHSHLP